MIEFRSFRNTDPPLIAQLWCDAPAVSGLMHTISVSVLERHVFSKPFFDRHGFIMAFDGDRLVGFVHGGFGPDDSLADISMESGIICMVMVLSDKDYPILRNELIEHAEQYLKSRGVREVHAGCINTRSPFYLGLYGGSDMAGILESDERNFTVFSENGYESRKETQLFVLDTNRFRAPADRDFIRNRRKFNVETDFDIRSGSWWEACQFGQIDRIRCRLRPRFSGPPIAELTLWEMSRLNPELGQSSMGLIDLFVNQDSRERGMAGLLVAEAIEEIKKMGVGTVHAQTKLQNEAAMRLFDKIGFERTDIGYFMSKKLED